MGFLWIRLIAEKDRNLKIDKKDCCRSTDAAVLFGSIINVGVR